MDNRLTGHFRCIFSALASAGCQRSKATTRRRKFKPYPIGFFHVDIAEVRTRRASCTSSSPIDRTSKFAFAQLLEKQPVTASAFLEAMIEVVSYAIHTVLTDNGSSLSAKLSLPARNPHNFSRDILGRQNKIDTPPAAAGGWAER